MTVLLVTKLFVLCVIFLCGPDPSPHTFIFFNIKEINFGVLKFYKQTGGSNGFYCKSLVLLSFFLCLSPLLSCKFYSINIYFSSAFLFSLLSTGILDLNSVLLLGSPWEPWVVS